MNKEMKQCRVCGDPIEFHRLPMKDCIIKAYNLPLDWKGDYPALFSLCNTKGLATAWGQPSKGVTSIKFKALPEATVTTDPVFAITTIILTQLAPSHLAKVERSIAKDEVKAEKKAIEEEELD